MTLLRSNVLLIAVLAFVAPLYFVWTWSGQIGQLGTDGPSYMMMAQHYSLHGTPDPVYARVAVFSRFPPLYPMVLAWLGASTDLLCAHIVTTCCLLIALVALYFWLRGEGIASEQSALLVLLCAVLPGTWLLGLSIQSEYLYLFWSLLALTMLSAHQRNRRDAALYGAALAIAAAILTRTIGVALFVPFLLQLWRAPRRSAALALIVAVLPLAEWHLLHSSDTGYMRQLGVVYGADGFSGLRTQLAIEVPALYHGFVDNFVLNMPAGRPLAEALGVLCMAGMGWRICKLKPDALYTAGNGAILLVWPFPEEAQRFLWVLLPLLLAQALLLITNLSRRPAHVLRPKMLASILAAAILAMALPSLAFAVDRYRSAAYSNVPGVHGYLSWYGANSAISDRQVALQKVIIDTLRSIPEHVPATDCIVANKPDLVSYFGHRRAVFSPLNSIPDPYFEKVLRASGCHYAFGYSAEDRRYPELFHPLQRIKSQSTPVLIGTLSEEEPGLTRLACELVRLK